MFRHYDKMIVITVHWKIPYKRTSNDKTIIFHPTFKLLNRSKILCKKKPNALEICVRKLRLLTKIKPSLMAKESKIIAVSERLTWMAKFINEVKRFSYRWWNVPSQMQLPHPESFWNTWIVSNFTLMYGWFKSLELRISCRMLSKTTSYGCSNVMGQYFDTIRFRRFCFIWGGRSNYI